MKASKFSDAQKAFILKEGADGIPVAELCRKAGISQATYFNWKKKYDGLLPTEMRRLKLLEDENAKLRKLVADLSLDREMLQDVIRRKNLRPARKRKLVDAVRGEWDISIRRACRVLEVDPSTYHYKPRRHDQAAIEARIKEICMTRMRYGYRRVHVVLRREGWDVNVKKIYRIYNELGLKLRNKTPKRRVKAKLRDDRRPAIQANETWAMDFVHDQLATGRKVRILTIVDIFSRFSPMIDPRFSYRAEDVVAVLEQVCATVGYPKTIRVDQGSEFISRDLDLWAYANNVMLDFSRPGKPTDNAFIEAFNGRLRAECLNAHWFLTLADAREKLEAWRRDYNEVRPHGAIGNRTPISLHIPGDVSSPLP
ncbi:IS3 family transposase [Gluconacetobacter azotocaptans]|uniref:IS3 family transposase n=1 Tax=Gluconacetobacter azotocaptans TaxID=142834 RepID=UPI00195B590D|nr:IS3 family transposase [Gluconacetobacter azotocaptans]MBM9401153.1 IS3 family transposase [Gluconacetobacter azotocaptans]